MGGFTQAVVLMKKVSEEREEEKIKEAVLTPPLCLEGGLAVEHRAPGILNRLFSLFKSVRPGSDLTRFQLPPLFNMPKSQLQLYGESLYCIGEDMLSKCAEGKNSLERFNAVVAWSISTARPLLFGVAPFNPVLGETHHVTRGTLNVLLEQVSHHPPVSALHATDEKEDIELIWSQSPVPKFNGTSVEAVVHGKRQLKLLKFGETYELNCPKLLIRLFPMPGAEWAGNVKIRCKDSGLDADLNYRGPSLLGFGGNARSVKGNIFCSSTRKKIYEIDGHWDRVVTLKEVDTGKVTVLYSAEGAISILKAPILKDPKGLLPSESALVWSEVSKAIINKDWEKAREAKREIEERERKLQRERKSNGTVWVPKNFNVVYNSKDNEWECSPIQHLVPQAPIVASP